MCVVYGAMFAKHPTVQSRFISHQGIETVSSFDLKFWVSQMITHFQKLISSHLNVIIER